MTGRWVRLVLCGSCTHYLQADMTMEGTKVIKSAEPRPPNPQGRKSVPDLFRDFCAARPGV